MLSYRHGFHAGNSADVLKHLVLVALLRAMTRKETPLCYIETHAGAGRYDLRSEFAGVNSEHALGIARLIARLDGDAPELVTEYVAAIRAANTLDAPESLRWYPGSPSIARHWLRQADSLWLAELHPAEHAALVDLMASRAGAHVHKKDGYGLLKAVLPPKERRALVLIDPAYELDGEATRILNALREALRRMRHGVYVVWAPLRGKVDAASLTQRISALHPEKLLRIAMVQRSGDALGSIVLVLNPPFRVDEELRGAFAWMNAHWPEVNCTLDWCT